jgi:hypothetical protein
MKEHVVQRSWEIELVKKYRNCGLDVIETYRTEKYYPIIGFKTYYKTDIVLTCEVQQDGKTVGSFTGLEELERAYLEVALPWYQQRTKTLHKTLWQKIKGVFKR